MSDNRSELPRYPSFWNRVAGGIIGSCIVGVVTACFRYSTFAWLPVLLGTIMALFGWKVHPPEGIKDAARGVIEKVENTLDHTADKLKDAREAMEAAKEKAELEAKELKATAAREHELFAQKLRDLDDKVERCKKELEDKLEEHKRSLAVKTVEKVVENRVHAARSGLSSLVPSWGSSPPIVPQKTATPPKKTTMIRLAHGGLPNARCPSCNSALIIGDIVRDDSTYPSVVSQSDAILSRTALARPTFSRMSSALAVHTNGLGSLL